MIDAKSLNISLIIGIIAFILVIIVDYFFILLPKYKLIMGKKSKKKNKSLIISEVEFLKYRFKLDARKMDLKYMIKCIAFINAFIIAFTSFVIMIIPLALVWQLLIGFVLVFALIYTFYELFGRWLVKKGWN